MVKIKVIKSSRPYYWYANHINETFEVKKKQPKFYLARGFGYEVIRTGVNKRIKYFVDTSDCEITS